MTAMSPINKIYSINDGKKLGLAKDKYNLAIKLLWSIYGKFLNPWLIFPLRTAESIVSEQLNVKANLKNTSQRIWFLD